jgi:hypothetical protein
MTQRPPSTKQTRPDAVEVPDLGAPLLGLGLDPAWHRATWSQRGLMLLWVALSGLIGGAVLAAGWLYADRVAWPVW